MLGHRARCCPGNAGPPGAEVLSGLRGAGLWGQAATASSCSAGSLLLFCLCSPVGKCVLTDSNATCWAGQLPSLRGITCYMWGEAGADPAVLAHLFPCPPADFGTHQLSVSIHLSSVFWALGSLVVRSGTSKDLESSPGSASSKLCDLGQATLTLCASSVTPSVKYR